MSLLHLWYSELYSAGIHQDARFPRARYEMVYRLLDVMGAPVCIHEAKPVASEDILLCHDPQYVHDFLHAQLSEKAIRRIGLRPWTKDIIPRTLCLVGGTLAATKHVLQHGGFAGNLAGGTHHAFYDCGSGYCIFNDIAVSASWAQQYGHAKQILVIDLDVHQGDGTAQMFATDDSVWTFSMHCGKNFPFRKQTSNLDISLQSDMQDEEYLHILATHLPQLVEQVEPDLVFYQAGVDSLREDKLGKLALTASGLKQRNEMVYQELAARNIPTVLTMGGGYSEPLIHSVEAHADVFLGALQHQWSTISQSRMI